jgi:hypothetical protein
MTWRDLTDPASVFPFSEETTQQNPPSPRLNPMKESDMAKGQKRNSREAKKPKASKPATTAAAPSLASRGISSLITPKKKG